MLFACLLLFGCTWYRGIIVFQCSQNAMHPGQNWVLNLNQGTPNYYYPQYQSLLSCPLLRLCGSTFVKTAVYVGTVQGEYDSMKLRSEMGCRFWIFWFCIILLFLVSWPHALERCVWGYPKWPARTCFTVESDKAFRRHASHPHQTFQGFLVVPNTTVIGEDFYKSWLVIWLWLFASQQRQQNS